jgi:DNA-directed RNA polymerase specialized sigma subunit
VTINKLKEYWWKRKNIEQLTETLEALRALRGCQSPHMSDEPRSTEFKDKIGDLVVKLDEVETELMIKYSEAYDALKAVENAIASLPEREQFLMRLRYIQFKDWPEICILMNYGWSQTHWIHSHALRQLGIKKTVHNRTK